MITLAEIAVYPVKSCRGIPLGEATLTPRGIQWDRTWMLVDRAGTFVSQRTHPQLARIETRLTPEGVELRAPGMSPLLLPFEADGSTVGVRVWKDAVQATDVGNAAAAWVSDAAGDRLRVVRAGKLTDRHANPEFAGDRFAPIAFPDAYPVLVCNRASLAELNRRMPEPIPMTRFRPNLVLEGLEAFAEDHIGSVMIGDVTLRLVKPCTRCAITSTDQMTGARDMATNPLPVLKSFRFDRKLLGVTFGMNAVVEQSGRVLRGAPVTTA